MSLNRVKQQPLRLTDAGKRDVRTQFGALCWRRRKDKIEVLLITSRRRKRWILPKGWPVDGATPCEAAETEAWEEAGVIGRAKPVCLGIYSYSKMLDKKEQLPCVVAVFPVKVKNMADKYPERSERRRKWFSLKKAAAVVSEPELAGLLARFNPKSL